MLLKSERLLLMHDYRSPFPLREKCGKFTDSLSIYNYNLQESREGCLCFYLQNAIIFK